MSDHRDDTLWARVLGEVVPDAVIMHDTRGRIVDVNDAMCRMTGYSREELLELDVADIEMNIDPGAFWDDMSIDEVFTVEGRHLRKDGSSYPVETKVSAFMSEDRKVICGFCRDITTRKEREEELQRLNEELAEARDEAVRANEAKSSFLASVSHELRTPLNAIIGYSEMLRDDFAAEGLGDYVPDAERIRRAGRQLLALINDVLDLSKIEAGRMDVELAMFEARDLIEELEETIGPLAAENGNDFSVEVELDQGISLFSDQGKIRQILLNLLSNACKFTSDGTIVLGAKRSTRDDVEGILWSVADTGIGMTEEQVELVFDEYTQAEASTRERYGGTGLGLTISQQLCWLLGGELDAESSPGEGSTFYAWLPVDARDAAPARQRPPSSEAAVSGKVLVIDDDPDARELLRRTIEPEGYEVLLAADGREGLKLAREHKPTAITLDLLMPEPDGWTVLSLLKRNPRLARIPVFLVSTTDEQQRGFALGADEFLSKPVDRRELLDRLERYRGDEDGGPVLVVEDDEGARAMLRRVLSEDGWEVVEASDGATGLQKAEAQKPGLVVLDLMMPTMDGFEFLTEFRRVEAYRDVPVVVLTAKDLTADERKRLEGGVAAVLQKGTEMDELLQRVRALVREGAGDHVEREDD